MRSRIARRWGSVASSRKESACSRHAQGSLFLTELQNLQNELNEELLALQWRRRLCISDLSLLLSKLRFELKTVSSEVEQQAGVDASCSEVIDQLNLMTTDEILDSF